VPHFFARSAMDIPMTSSHISPFCLRALDTYPYPHGCVYR
jgi:hypothetical protein